jgi:TRAP-type C4-dicarboxylate transport system substrate-binding protein
MNSAFGAFWRRAASVVFMAMAGGAFTVPATAQTSLRMAVIPVPGSFYSKVSASVPERVAKATGGMVKVEMFDSLIPGGQLASAVREGRVDMAGVIHPYLSSEDPRLTLSHLPGLIDNSSEYQKVLSSSWGAEMDEIWLKKYNAVRLMDGIWAAQAVFSRKPIRKIEDFRGLKIRVHNTEAANLMTALGAKPTPVAANEMLPALERGVIDAIITSIDVAQGLRFGDVAKHVQMWSFSSRAGFAIVINANTWNKLPPAAQTAMRKEMADIQREHFAQYEADNAKIIAAWKADKVDYYEVPAAELKRLYDPKFVNPVYEAWIKRAESVDGKATAIRAQTVLGKQVIK